MRRSTGTCARTRTLRDRGAAIVPTLLVVALALASACDESGPAVDDPTPERTAPTRPAAETALPEAETTPASWPADVEDLATSVAQFQSVDACVAALRARTPTAVSEGIADLEYDGFFEDVCRATEAVRDRAPERCDALAVSTLRRGCRTRLAIVAGDPELCPDDRTLEGRDPLCVAWAARAPGLCRAVLVVDRVACEAVLANDRGACAHERDRGRCEAWVGRYASALVGERPEMPGTSLAPSLHLDLVRVYPSAPGSPEREEAPIAIDLEVLSRGVRLAVDGCSHRVILDERGERAVLSIQRPGARIGFAIAIGEPPIEIPILPGSAAIEISHPDHGRASGGEGTITVTEVGRARGATLAGTLEASMPMVPGTMRVRGTFRTFVRDLDALPGRCAGDRMPPP